MAPTATSTQFEVADLFTQDLVNEYKPDELSIYGITLLCNMTLSAEPPDAIARLKGAHLKYWISRQPMTGFADEDSVNACVAAYQTIPTLGMQGSTEGVVIGTTKKKLIPMFVPIKSSVAVIKTAMPIIYLYNDATIVGYVNDSAGGAGNLTGSVALDHRLIIGTGFLPEEVEELLSPSQ